MNFNFDFSVCCKLPYWFCQGCYQAFEEECPCCALTCCFCCYLSDVSEKEENSVVE